MRLWSSAHPSLTDVADHVASWLENADETILTVTRVADMNLLLSEDEATWRRAYQHLYFHRGVACWPNYWWAWSAVDEMGRCIVGIARPDEEWPGHPPGGEESQWTSV